MDIMLLGETVSAGASGQDLNGFWMPAAGNDGVAGVEVFYCSAANAFKIHIDTKSSDESDANANAGTASIGNVTISAASAATYKFDVTNAKDLIRYRVESLGSGNVHLQFAQPLWQPN